jgi:outer membrane protein
MMTTVRTASTRALAATATLLLLAPAVFAADLAPLMEPAPEAATETFAAPSPWQVRVRGLGVITNDSGSVNGVGGSDLSYSDSVIPELDITYYLTDNFAAELILGTTYSNIHAEGSLAAVGKVGKTWLLPPTLTLQYHFTDFGAFKPYVGAGVNYTMFYSQKGDAATALDVKNTFGTALQVGADYMINEHWGVNFDVKKLFLKADFDATIGGTNYSGKAKLDPWLIGAGITYRF